jgi:DNA (cytosine-5)-methyltransferase 1
MAIPQGLTELCGTGAFCLFVIALRKPRHGSLGIEKRHLQGAALCVVVTGSFLRQDGSYPTQQGLTVQSPNHLRAIAALQHAYQRFSREEIAEQLDVSVRTLERWESRREVEKPKMVLRAVLHLVSEADANVARPHDFTFIDLFAGIGGTRLGFERARGGCVFTSEYDKYCVRTYTANFRPSHAITGDIQEITAPPNVADRRVPDYIRSRVPEHDVLVAGFPCQPFSIAGVSKKNALGRAHGFACETQGTLFFDICRILEARRPLAFMLENVRNLKSHDRGRTFDVIMRSLAELGYSVAYRVIDAIPWVPQHRERVFIVGFREPTGFDFADVRVPEGKRPTLEAILHPENGTEPPDGRFTLGRKGRVAPQYSLTEHLWDYLQRYAAKHKAAGNGFGFGLVNKTTIARTLSARYFKDGSEILVDRGRTKTPRRLTPRECARLLGFPESFTIPVSDTQAYKQFGNSVVVPVVHAVADAMRPHILALRARVEANQVGMPV